jgi:hypothetical protein
VGCETAALADVVSACRSFKRLIATVRMEREKETGEPVGMQ